MRKTILLKIKQMLLRCCCSKRQSNNDIKINAIIGDVINTSIKAKIEDFIQTNSIQDYINGKVLEINTGDVSTNCFIVSLDNFIKIQSDEIAIPLNINVFDDCPVGNYQIRAILNNEGNENLSSEFFLLGFPPVPIFRRRAP